MRREYQTKQKNEILKYIVDNKDEHFTLEGLYDALKNSGVNIGKTTVYRFVEHLYNNGTLRKTFSEDRSGCCYQYVSDECKEHFHLKCTSCGSLFHTDCEEILKIINHFKKEHSFTVDSSKTVFYGLCEKCGGIIKNV